MNIMHKLAEDAIGTILAGSDDWIDDDKSHDFEGDYDWVNDDTCMLYFRVDGKYIGSWDVDIAEIEDIMVLDDISSEVEAAVSGMERSEYNESLSKLNESNHTMKENINESKFDFDNDFILDIVKMGYETGHQIFDSYEDFIEDEEVQDIDDKEAAWDFYCDLIDMGPAGFYEEYKDELDFNEDFINEYDNDVINEQCKKMRYVEADDFDDEIGPNAYKYIFKALDKSYWDDFEWSDVEYYDGKPCKVIDTSVVLHDFKSSYHDIEFKDGTVLSAISGMHLYPVKTETNDRKIKLETTTNNFKSRDALINEIEKYYNKPGYIGDLSQNYKGLNMEWYEFVEKEIKKITGKSIESLPDNDPDEGFYSNLSTSELTEVLNDINNIIDNLTKDSKVTVELTNQELDLIKTAMEMWSNTSFSKSREESDVAKDILNKLK